MMRDGDTPLIDAARYGRAADVATRKVSSAVSSASDGCASAGCESSSTLLQRASARPSSSPQRSASEPAKAQSWSAVEVQASAIVAKKSVEV